MSPDTFYAEEITRIPCKDVMSNDEDGFDDSDDDSLLQAAVAFQVRPHFLLNFYFACIRKLYVIFEGR